MSREESMPDPRPALGLRRVVNAAGTETSWGASLARPEAIAAAAAILPHAVDLADLQRVASRTIAKAFAAQAGCVTASAAAGITLAVAAAMTGSDLAAIAALPDRPGPRRKVILQAGHAVDYGAPVEQAVRLAGAETVRIGAVTGTAPWELEAALGEDVAAILHVVSHHCCRVGELSLQAVIRLAGARGIPVILDAASEESAFDGCRLGADLVLLSAHKFLGGLTAGIVAGRKDLVRAVYLQNRGIGRGFKVGKEAIAATIAVLEAWHPGTAGSRLASSRAIAETWRSALAGLPGITPSLAPDPTGNPLVRLRVEVAADAPFAAWDLVDALLAGDPPVAVRCPEVDRGYVELDPATLAEGEAQSVAPALARAMAVLASGAQARQTFEEWRAAGIEAALRWPD